MSVRLEMNDFFNLLKNKKILYAAIGINLGIFGMGFFLADPPLMLLALMSIILCYIGAEHGKE